MISGIVPSDAGEGDDDGSQTDVVIRSIKQMIIRGELGPGARLPVEKDLAVSLGVSRGPLREAVRALCIMGVLETRQGAGTFVTSLDSTLLLAPLSFMVDLQLPENQHHLHAVRRVLESEAAARAAIHMGDDGLASAQAILDDVRSLLDVGGAVDHDAIMNLDIAFHRTIAKNADNTALKALIDATASRTAGARYWLALTRENQEKTGYEEHSRILEAIRAREPDRARLLMGHHLLAIEDLVHKEVPGDASVQI